MLSLNIYTIRTLPFVFIRWPSFTKCKDGFKNRSYFLLSYILYEGRKVPKYQLHPISCRFAAHAGRLIPILIIFQCGAIRAILRFVYLQTGIVSISIFKMSFKLPTTIKTVNSNFGFQKNSQQEKKNPFGNYVQTQTTQMV